MKRYLLLYRHLAQPKWNRSRRSAASLAWSYWRKGVHVGPVRTGDDD